MSDELVFESLKPRVVTVRGDGRTLLLHEMTEDVATEVRARAAAAKAAGTPDDVAAAENGLYAVSLCLAEVIDGGEVPVSVEALRAMPSRVSTALAEKLNEISGVAQRDTADTLAEKIDRLREQREKLLANGNGGGPEKNGQRATTPISASPTS